MKLNHHISLTLIAQLNIFSLSAELLSSSELDFYAAFMFVPSLRGCSRSPPFAQPRTNTINEWKTAV